ncbi:MAG: GNAT family N-acetyltransferase [Clostridia bacterium]|nr:GNAT family N-acetyltransferase [Clostridia bacterium]
MKRYNIVMLADAAGENILMCRRMKPPYQGLYNLIGGKAEMGEDGLHAAYRELREETGVTAADATLHHLATFTYMTGGAGLPPYELMACVGRLRREVKITGDENPLCWMPLTENFFNMSKYAGEGSIGHVVESVRAYRPWMIEQHPQQVTITPLKEDDLPICAYNQGCPVESLMPMLAASQAKTHEGRYYEQFAIRADGCMVGTVSLFEHEDGTVCDGVDVFPPFRRCGFARRGLTLLMDIARARGFTVQTAQIRTDNAASIALHGGLGFVPGEPWINRKGNEVRTWRKELL